MKHLTGCHVTMRLQKSESAVTPMNGLEYKLAKEGIRAHVTSETSDTVRLLQICNSTETESCRAINISILFRFVK
jgi:hypothetical protein